MHARYYGSSIGRFMRPDPINGNPANPQSWNLYSYVRNNPVNATDPTGLTIRLTGEMKEALIDMFSSEMGLAVSEDESGDLTRAQGPPTPGNAPLVESFDAAASSETPLINVEAVGDSPLIQIDSFCCNPGQKENTPQISVTQLAAIPSQAPEGKSEMTTRGELLTHIMAEYAAAAQGVGFYRSTFDAAHYKAGLPFQNAYRESHGQTRVAGGTQIASGNDIFIEYESGRAVKIYMSKTGGVERVRYGWALLSWFW